MRATTIHGRTTTLTTTAKGSASARKTALATKRRVLNANRIATTTLTIARASEGDWEDMEMTGGGAGGGVVEAEAPMEESPAPAVVADAVGRLPGTEATELDPKLEPHADHLAYRYATYAERKKAIESAEGSLEAFSRGYERYGFTTDSSTGEITFREWAPAAAHVALIGDFNGWDG